MPTPRTGESKKAFLKRCIPKTVNDGTAKNSDQAVAICSSVYDRSKRKGKKKPAPTQNMRHSQYQEFGTNNIAPVVRYETLDGERYLVAPVAMLTEGVHSGNNGPVFYPRRELARTPEVHNHKPIVVYHPQLRGKHVSACSPAVLEKQSVGIVLNSFYDNKLRAEAWLKDKKIDKVDKRVRLHLESLRPMEVSTGLFSDNERLSEAKVYNGKRFRFIARNCRLDHLALLPDKKGACSIEDGAGLLQLNEEGIVAPGLLLPVWLRKTGFVQQGDIDGVKITALESALKKREGEEEWHGWIESVYDSSLVYWNEGTLYHQDFIANKSGKVKLLGDPEEVERVTQFRSSDGELLGDLSTNEEKKKMAKTKSKAKKELVDELLALEESGWDEGDRDGLMNLSDEKLTKLIENATPEDTDEEDEDEDDDDSPTRRKTPKVKVKVKAKAKKGAPNIENEEEDEEEEDSADPIAKFLATVPAPLRETMLIGARTIANQRARAIETITANKKNTFKKKYLEKLGLPELEGLAALAAPETNGTMHTQEELMSYLGQAAGLTDNEDLEEEEPLPDTEMTFELPGKKGK